MSVMKNAGCDVRSIAKKAYAKYETDKAKRIVLALDRCGIPYFARFDDTVLYLTYDESSKDSVIEIVRKALSGVYDEITAEIKHLGEDKYISLLPEIATLLDTTVSFLKIRPYEVQKNICKTYVNLWYCDSATLKRELSDMLMLNFTGDKENTAVYFSRERNRRAAESIANKQAHEETKRSDERERRI